MSYHVFPSATRNYRGNYSKSSPLESVGHGIEEEHESKYLSPCISCEICKETISQEEVDERYIVLDLATANDYTPEPHRQIDESQAGTPDRM